MTTCPCCGHSIKTQGDLLVSLDTNTAAVDAMSVRLSPQETEIIYTLSRAMPRTVLFDDLIAAVWGANECEVPQHSLHVLCTYARRKLRPLNIGIECVRGRGYRMTYLESPKGRPSSYEGTKVVGNLLHGGEDAD